MLYPTNAQIEAAGVGELLNWHRNLPLAQSDEQRAQLVRIGQRMSELRAADAGAFTAASKSIGWN